MLGSSAPLLLIVQGCLNTAAIHLQGNSRAKFVVCGEQNKAVSAVEVGAIVSYLIANELDLGKLS